MHTTQADFAEAYRKLRDDEVADLYAQIGTLTNEARAALQTEIQRRGISAAKLRHLKTAELQREAKFDKLQKIHEKEVADYVFHGGLGQGFWAVLAIAVGLISAVIWGLIAGH